MNKLRYILLCISSLLMSQAAMSATAVLEDFSGPISLQKFTEGEENRELDTSNQNLILSSRGKSFLRTGHGTSLDLNDNTNLLQADLSIAELTLGNVDTQQALARLGGIYYKSAIGDITVDLVFGNRGNGLEAWYEIREPNADGSTNLMQGSLSSSALSLNTSYSASITYDNDNNFSFVFDNGTPVNVTAPVRISDPDSPRRRVSTRVRFGHNNGTPDNFDDEKPDDGSTASIAATFDNVTTSSGLFDDFSATALDIAKWINDERSKTITNQGQLRMAAKRQEGSRRLTQRLFIRKQGLMYLGANVTLSSDSVVGDSSTVRGRIVDYLGNDTFDVSNGDTPNGLEGNIWTQLALDRMSDGSFRAFAHAARVLDANNDSRTDLFLEVLTPTNPIAYDQQYALAIEQTGTVVNYKIDNEVLHSFDLLTDPLLSGNIYPEVNGLSNIAARVQSGSGKAVVLFDDITIDSIPIPVSLDVKNGDGEIVALPATVIVNEGELVTLLANVPEPLSVQNYIWEQTAGPDVDIQDAATSRVVSSNNNTSFKLVGSNNTLSFNVPAGSDTQNLAFKLTVLNDAGVESSQAFAFKVDNSATPTLASTPVTPISSGGGGAFNPFFLIFWLIYLGIAKIRSIGY